MVALNIKAFRGEVPRMDGRLLNDNQAQAAMNCKITSGRIDPLRAPSLVYQSLQKQPIQTAYHYVHGRDMTWMTWPRVVDVVRAPIAQDHLGRLYYTGDGEPRMTTYKDGVSGSPGPFPAKSFVLGVTAPKTAPTITIEGGSGDKESRAYVSTFVTQYGEESGPSPAALESGFISGRWHVSNLQAPPANSGNINQLVSAAGTARMTTDSTYGLLPGDLVRIAGAGIDALNGLHTIAQIIDGTQFTVALDAVGTAVGGTWTRVAGHNLSGMTRRIYRTSGTHTTFRRVADIDAAVTAYVDEVKASQLFFDLPTREADLPPKGLHSLIGLPNGALAGLVGNELCFSEPYQPHSWPTAYRYSFPATGVALSAVGNSVIVLTDSFPYLATATVPSAVSMSQIETYAPCVAKLGVVDIGEGCIYPSYDGLYLASAGPVRNLTQNLFRRDEWATLNPQTFYAAFHDQKYYARHANIAGEDSMLVMDITESDSMVHVGYQPHALYASQVDGKLYVAKGNAVYEWDADMGKFYLAYWKSKEFVLPLPVNFAVAQVYARFDQSSPVDPTVWPQNLKILDNADNLDGALGSDALNAQTINGSEIRPVRVVSAKQVQFTLLIDDQAVYSTKVTDSRPFRLPAGYTSDNATLEIAANVPVLAVAVAQTLRELKGVA